MCAFAFQVISFLQVFLSELCKQFSSLSYVLFFLLILFSFVCYSKWYMVRTTNHYVLFFFTFCYMLPLKPVIFQRLFPSIRPSVTFHGILLCCVQKLLATYPSPRLKDHYLLILVATFCTTHLTLSFISRVPLFHHHHHHHHHPQCVPCCANWWSL